MFSAVRGITLPIIPVSRQREGIIPHLLECWRLQLVQQAPVLLDLGLALSANVSVRETTNQNSLFRSCDWLLANQGASSISECIGT